MSQDLFSPTRLRRLAPGLFLVVASLIAGYGVSEGKMKILGLLALFTAGFLLRQASVRNAYWLAVTALQLSHTRLPMIRDEFELDRWLGLAFVAVLSLGLVILHLDQPAWPGIAHFLAFAMLVTLTSTASWSPDPRHTIGRSGALAMVLIVAWLGVWSHGTSLARLRGIADVHVDMLWIVFPLGFVIWILPFPGDMSGGRFQSIYENPNTLGMWCSVGLPLAYGMAQWHPIRWRRQVAWLMLGTGIVVTVLSGSRGGVVGALIGIGIYEGFRRGRRVVAVVLAGIAAAGLLALFGVDLISRSDTLMTLVRPETLDDMSSRRMWWELGILIAQQKPLLGHGFGIGETLYSAYMVDVTAGNIPPTVHNTYLSAWMEAGYLGVGLLLAVIGWSCWLGLRAWSRDRQGELGLLALTLTGSAVALAAHSFVEEKLLSAGNPWTLPFWVTLALIARLHRLQATQAAEAREFAHRRARPRAPWAQAMRPPGPLAPQQP